MACLDSPRAVFGRRPVPRNTQLYTYKAHGIMEDACGTKERGVGGGFGFSLCV